ncbi:hypothetical protein HPP92_004002, partial [Vanilla planifolia]
MLPSAAKMLLLNFLTLALAENRGGDTLFDGAHGNVTYLDFAVVKLLNFEKRWQKLRIEQKILRMLSMLQQFPPVTL